MYNQIVRKFNQFHAVYDEYQTFYEFCKQISTAYKMRNSALRGNFCLLFRRNTLLKLVKLHHMCDWNAAWRMIPRFCSASSHLLFELCVDASGEIRTVSPVLFVKWRKHAYFNAWNILYAVRPVGGLAWYTDAHITAHACCISNFILLFVHVQCTQPATFAMMTMQLWYHWHNRLQAHRTFTTWVSIASATAISNTYSEQYDSVTHFISFGWNFSGIFLSSFWRNFKQKFKLRANISTFFTYSHWVYNFTEFAFR